MAQQVVIHQEEKAKVTVTSDALRNVPVKHFYPRPVTYIGDDGEEVILFVSHTDDSLLFRYRSSTDKYKKLMDYPKAKMKFHTIECNTLTKQLYIYDGVLPTFFILSINQTSTQRASDLRVSSRKLIKLHNVIKTGKNVSSLYIGEEYNEYYIIGGSQNNKQYIWNNDKQKFELYSIFNGEQQKCLQECTFLFIKSKNCFVIFGGNLEHNMYALKYDQTKSVQSRNWYKIGSPFPLSGKKLGNFPIMGQTEDYGYCLYKDKFILVFGGFKRVRGGQIGFFAVPRGDMDDIHICSIENGFKWYEPLCRLPQAGRYHAVYLAKSDKIHIFKKFDKNAAHWEIDPKSIFKACDDDKININTLIIVNEQKQNSSQSQEAKNDDGNNDNDVGSNNMNNNDDIKVQLNGMMKTINDLQTEVALLKSKVMILEKKSGIKDNDENKLQSWLTKMDMTEYYMLFLEQGFGDDISSLVSLNENDLISIGIKKMGHRKKLLTEIKKEFANNTNDTEGY